MISTEAKKQIAGGSQIRKMFEEGKRLAGIYGAENVYDFSLGNPDQEPPREIIENLREDAASDAKGLHSYMANAGYPEAREAVARYESQRSGQAIEASGVVMTVGAAGALAIILRSLCDQGDEVIIIAPYFTEYTHYIRLAGAVPVRVDCRANFQPDLAAIEAAITPRTKAIIVNSPNNPSGVVYSATTYEALHVLLSKQAQTIYVISDEPYREIAYDGVEVPAVMRYIPNAIVAYSWSKSYALPGERIGYACVAKQTEDYQDLCQALVLYNRTLGFVNAPALWQRVVTRSLDLPISVENYQRRRDMMLEIFADCGLACQKPDGAFYLFPKVPNGLSEEAFVAKCAEHRILLVGASGFGKPGYVRLSYAVPEDMIKRSADAFKAVMADLK